MTFLLRLLPELAFVVFCGWSSTLLGWWFLVLPVALAGLRITDAVSRSGA